MCSGAPYNPSLTARVDCDQFARRAPVSYSQRVRSAGDSRHGGVMQDMIFLVAGVGFFLAAIAYTFICERL